MLLTGQADQTSIDALEELADHFTLVPKPWNKDELKETIRAALINGQAQAKPARSNALKIEIPPDAPHDLPGLEELLAGQTLGLAHCPAYPGEKRFPGQSLGSVPIEHIM